MCSVSPYSGYVASSPTSIRTINTLRQLLNAERPTPAQSLEGQDCLAQGRRGLFLVPSLSTSAVTGLEVGTISAASRDSLLDRDGRAASPDGAFGGFQRPKNSYARSGNQHEPSVLSFGRTASLVPSRAFSEAAIGAR